MIFLLQRSQPIGLLTLAYAAVGWLGMSLVPPPFYGSPVFPAAGLALAFVLVHGYRVLPGVWLGALLMSQLVGWQTETLGPATWLLGIAEGTGATLQAALGAWLIDRPRRCDWQRMEQEGDILRFMLRAGLLAGVISASIGISAANLLGLADHDQVLLDWWLWYSGDVLGIMLCAPLILSWLLGGQQAIWRSRRYSLMLPTLLALLIASLIYLAAWHWKPLQPSEIQDWVVPAIGGIFLLFAALLQMLLLGMTGRASLLQRKNDELEASEARYRSLFNASPLPSWLLERDSGHFLMVNQRAIEHYGWSLEQWQGMRLQDILVDTGSSADMNAVPGEAQRELQHRRRDGSLIDVRVHSSAAQCACSAATLEIVQDVTAEKHAQQHISFLAYHDTLTGLPNRALGWERLQHALASAHRNGYQMGVLCLDIDNFKHVNDAHGHAVGDSLLKVVAAKLNSCLRASDTLCRISGDEFVVVLPDLSSDHQVVQVCERILGQFTTALEIEGGLQLVSSLSIGVAVYPQHGAVVSTLVRHADLALYQAKKAGRNTYRFFQQQMNEALQRYLQTCAGLREALEREEFELYYQPQLSLHSGELVAVEALIRWNRPGQGLVLPADFIEIAEENGLIVPIGRWVLEQACQQVASWQRAGKGEFMLAVNLSAEQFRRGEIEQDVLYALETSGLDPSRLELELTESMLLQTGVLTTLERWKARGISLSIDDFGTGYSSLSYLKHINLDKLKIDRSFIAQLHQDAKNHAIVKAIIEIARSLGLRTTAEGIEQPEVAEQLRILGCDAGQGYCYSMPLAAGEFEHWLVRYRPAGVGQAVMR
jgi:diguanylate cyclase (GGDEF)-like protein/PAS domain S-box-containing protein